MAEFTYTIGGDGDYSTIAGFLAAADAGTSNDRWIGQLLLEDFDEFVTINNSGADKTLEPHPSARHTFAPRTGARIAPRTGTASSNLLYFDQSDFELRDLEITAEGFAGTPLSGHAYGLKCGSNNKNYVYIQRCLIYGIETAASGYSSYGMWLSSGSYSDRWWITGNVVFDPVGTNGYGMYVNMPANGDYWYVENNLIYGPWNRGLYIYNNAASIYARNNISSGATYDFYFYKNAVNRHSNVSSDGTATGTNGWTNRDISTYYTSLTAGSEDFRLKDGSEPVGAGYSSIQAESKITLSGGDRVAAGYAIDRGPTTAAAHYPSLSGTGVAGVGVSTATLALGTFTAGTSGAALAEALYLTDTEGGDYSQPIDYYYSDPAETQRGLTLLDRSSSYKFYVSAWDTYGFPTGTSPDTIFTTKDYTRERPRVGANGIFARSSKGWYTDRLGVLAESAQHTIRDGHWLRAPDGVWRRVTLLEPGRTNLVHRPTGFEDGTVSPWTTSGDAAATLSVVDRTEELADVGLLPHVPGGKVLRLDNSGGTSIAYAKAAGKSTGSDPHSLSAYVMGGSGDLHYYATAGVFGSSTTFRRVLLEGATADTSRPLLVGADPGQVVDFILPQLEEGGFATSPIPHENTASGETRAADELFHELSGDAATPGPLTIYFRWIALMDGGGGASNPRIWQISDANNANPKLLLYFSSDRLRLYHHNGSSAAYTTLPTDVLTVERGDEMEAVAVIRSDGSGTLIASKNGAPVVSSNLSAHTLAGSWSAPQFWVGSSGSLINGSLGWIDAKIVAAEVIGTHQEIMNRARVIGYRKAV